jgi:cyclic dehypoxanthinyl futalosine synthase
MNNVENILNKALNGTRISDEEAVTLFKSADLKDLGYVANEIRKRQHPDTKTVTFVVDRNVNYTNTCTAACRFCAFAFWPGDKRTYVLPYEEIKEKIQELVDLNGTQLLLQGGHNPDLKIEYYEGLFKKIKEDFPSITLHALSPSEIEHISLVSNIPMEEVIQRLIKAGWDSLPGGGAEILVKRVRDILSPLKTTSEAWLKVMELAHKAALGSSATMMFGHVETYAERVEHMARLRELQDKTGGFRAFISWTFQPGDTPLSKDAEISRGEGTGDGLDYLRTQAISRIYLDNFKNIQASWVTQGFGIGQMALHYGANDFGGTMLEENVVSAAGNTTSKSNSDELIYQINHAGFNAAQRDTFYNILKTFDTVASSATN